MNGAGGGGEAEHLHGEIAWLKQQIPHLTSTLAQLQQQHATLSAAQQAPPAAQPAPHQGGHQPAAQPQPGPTPQTGPQQAPGGAMHGGAAGGGGAPAGPHSAAWTEQVNPENGATYYWNSVTGESTWTRPPDYQPGRAAAGAGAATAVGLPQTKGPPGANLFVVRKMRRGEYDAFNAEDLRREFSKYGTVTRAEITIDRETGWPRPKVVGGAKSKGFGFVSFSSVEFADAAVGAIHGAWMDGREMKVEKTKEDGSGGGFGGYQ